MEEVDPKKTSKKHHLISDTLRERIVAGEYTGQIPGQRVLAEEFGVNFLTIRKAVATLVKEGLLDKQTGRGTFITRLRRNRTHNLAAILGGLSYGFGGTHTKLIEGIQKEASRLGHDLIYRPHLGDPQVERQAIEDLVSRGKCDGVLVWPTRNEGSRAVETLKGHGIPFVVVMRLDARYRQDVSYVVDDDFEGGYLATRHLLDQGHRALGFVGRSARSEGADTFEEERWLGFIKAHAEAGLSPGARVQADWLLKPEAKAGPLSKAFLKRISGLSGLVCVNDRVALHLLSLPEYTTLSIPGQMSIVGYDDIDAAELFNLTTIHQPLEEIGAEAVRLLIEEIEGGRTAPAQRKLAPRLVVRGTTAPRGA
jgi:DNA-binding LacI/PurR family transcriptional regulator